MESVRIITPGNQCRQMNDVTNLLVDQYQPEYLVCFGCIHDSKTATSCFTESLEQSHTHYFFLMIMPGTTRIEHEVQEYVNAHYDKACITVLVHGIETVNEAIRQGSRFFNLVCGHGMQFYSKSGLRMALHLPAPNPAVILEKAERDYFHRYNRALGFMEAADDCIQKGFDANAVFMLHQAVEQACIAMIRVYLAYRVDIHNLTRLLNLMLCFSEEPAAVFPRKTAEDQRLFQLLLRSYSDARYRDEYVVSQQDAALLNKQVKAFIGVTEMLCTNRINQFRNEVIASLQ